METVAFYSYKGGVGRTLLVANTAQFLAMSGCRIVVLDLDLEAPGLHYKLGNRDVIHLAECGKLRGAIDELLDTLVNEATGKSLQETAIEVNLPSGTNGALLLIPAGSAPSHTYWKALEKLNNSLRPKRRNGGLLEAALELQARIADELAPEFLLVDSRTGITELGGLATSILADRVVCLTTTAPESVEGTKVVANALRNAPRLSTQKPLRLDFLVTRIESGSIHSPNVAHLIKGFGGTAKVLPHDSGIANEERVLSGWRQGQTEDSNDDSDKGERLFSATLDWISESFPGHKKGADLARRRMEAVHYVWEDLTRTSQRVRGGTTSREAWPFEQLRGGVRFKSGDQSRQADIAVYDFVSGKQKNEPLMIVEYVDNEDRDAVARWWVSHTRVQVVVVLSGNSDRRLYSRRVEWDSNARHSERWNLPLPYDFKALSDPTDNSIDKLLDAIHRGYPQYLDRIVREWAHCSASGLHGGAPWKPQIAKRIVDGLARIDDVELAKRVLWSASRDSLDREMWLGDGDDWLNEQVHAELFTPLLWRLPPEASIELMQGHDRPFGPPAGVGALSLLAKDLLGLRYDPDTTFRTEGQRILDRSVRPINFDDDKGLYGLIPAFKFMEITFEISSELPPLLVCAESKNDGQSPRDLDSLLSERIATRSLVTSGLLGAYQPGQGRVLLYNSAIIPCADKLALRPRHIGSVTLIHETIHALTHLGRDLDGRMWPEFSQPSASDPLFEPSWFHEAITQYFTYRHIVQLRDPALLQAFEVLSNKQAPAYRAWEHFRDIPIEDMRSWFMSVRRCVGTMAVPPHLLLYANREVHR